MSDAAYRCLERLASLSVVLLVGVAACANEASPAAPDGDALVQDDGTDGDDAAAEEVVPDSGDPDVSDTSDDLGPEPLPEVQPPDRNEARPAATGVLWAGVSVLALDPPVGVSMGGFGNRSGPLDSPWTDLFSASEGSHGHLWLKAIVFEVAGERLVILKVPLPFSEDSLTHAMLDALEARHGLDLRGRIITAATHTHHGPARFWRLPPPLGVAGIDNPDDELIRRFGDRMAEAVALAIEDLAPAEFGYTTVENWDPDDRVYRDRRSSNDPTWGKDPRLTVFAVRRPDGAPLAVMANFAMHGTILGSDNTLLSDDAAGGFEEELERRFVERFGVPAMGVFTQAGGGDAAPAGDKLGHRGPQRMQMVGVAGADAVLDRFEALDWRGSTELAVRSRMVGIAHGWIYGDSGEFDGPDGPITNGTIQCTIDPAAGVSQKGGPKDCIGLSGVFDLLDLPLPNPELNQTYLTVARLGDLFLVTLPGEPTHSIIEYARDEVEALSTVESPHNVMVVGYSQDHLLYFTHPDDWYTGDYEAEFSLWGPWAGQWLVDRQVATVKAMLRGENGPTYYEEVADMSPPLSTERRKRERSVAPGVLHRQPTVVERLDIVEVEVGGGDPALGMPMFVVERDDGSGGTDDGFVAVEVDGRRLDSARLDGVVLYRPTPENGPELLEERDHRWVWRWQVPPWMAAGRYRIAMSGRAVGVGDVESGWTASTDTFEIVRDADAEVALTALGEGRFKVVLSHPAAPLETAGGAYPTSGWRVFDTRVGPDTRVMVRAPIVIAASRGELRVEQTTSWDETMSGYILDLSGSPLATGAEVVIEVWLASDRVPSVMATTAGTAR